MADLDTLQIELSASDKKASQAVESLEKSLTSLMGILNGLHLNSSFEDGINGISDAINNMSSATRNVNSKDLKEFASALRSLSTAGEKMSGVTNSVQSVSRATKQASSSAKKEAKELAAAYHIKDKGAIADLTESIEAYHKAVENGGDTSQMRADIEKTIETFGKFEVYVDDFTKAIKDSFKGMHFSNKEFQDAFGDYESARKARGQMGIRNVTKKGSQDPSASIQEAFHANGMELGQDLYNHEALEMMKQALATNTDELQSYEEALRNGSEAARYLSDVLDDMYGKINEPVRAEGIVGYVEQLREMGMQIHVTAEEMAKLKGSGLEDIFTTAPISDNADDIFLGSYVTDLQSEMSMYQETIGQSISSTQEFVQAFQQATSAMPGYTQATQQAAAGQEGLKTSTEQTTQAIAQAYSQINADVFSQAAEGIRAFEGIDLSGLSNIKQVADGVRGFGYDAAVTAAQNLPFLAQGLQGLSGLSVPQGDYTAFAAGIAKLGGKKIQDAAYALPFLADGLKQMQGIELPSAAGVTEFATALNVFGRSTATAAVENIPRLAVAFRDLTKILSGASTVSQNVIDLANALANLAAQGGKTSSAVAGLTPRLHNYGSAARSATKHSFSLASAIGKVYATYWMLFRAFRMLGNAINISSSLTEVQNVVDQTFGNLAYKLDDIAKNSIQTLGMSELQLKQIASRYQAMSVAMGINNDAVKKSSEFLKENSKQYGHVADSAADMSIEITRLAADMASFYNVADYNEVAKDLEAIFTGQTRPLRKYGLDLTQATLQEWAMKNGIDANIQAMSQMEKTMLRYQYVLANTAAAQGDFARTSQTWANQIRILKQQFQALGAIIGGAFINVLKPAVQAINRFLNTLIALVQKAVNAIGKLLGWRIEIQEVGVAMDDADIGMGDFEDAAGGAADNLKDAKEQAKKLKDYVLGIDELNIIRPDDDDDLDKDKGKAGGSGSGLPSGGGGGAGQTTGGGVRFEKYDSDISTWFELGRKISDTLAEAMENIDLDSIYKKAEHFGTNLANFMNGLITPRLFAALGQTIAGALNTALHFLDSYGETFNWGNFGRSIAAGINKFFDTFDFSLLARTINVWAHGILDAIIAALDNIKWWQIGQKIGKFLSEIDFFGILKKVGKAIWKGINAAFEFYEGMFEAAPLETALLSLVAFTKLLKVKAIQDFAKAVSNAIGVVRTYGAALASTHSYSAAMAATFPKTTGVVQALQGAMLQFKLGMMETGSIATSLGGALESIGARMSPMAKGVTTVVAAFGEFFLVKDAVHDIATGTGSLIANLAELAVAVGAAGVAFTTVFGFPAGLVMTGLVGIIGAFAGLQQAMDEAAVQRYGDAVKSAFQTEGGIPVYEVVGYLADNLRDAGSGFEEFSGRSTALNESNKNIQSVWQQIDKIQTAMDNGVLSVEDGTARLGQLFGELETLTSTKFESISNSMLLAFGEGGAFSEYMEAAGAKMEGFEDAVIEWEYTSSERVRELTKTLAEADPNTEIYREAKKELLSLTTGLNDVQKAASDFEFGINSVAERINWDDFILDGGELDMEAFNATLDDIVLQVENYNTKVDEAAKTARQYYEELLSSPNLPPEVRAQWEEQLSYLPKAVELAKQDAALQAEELVDQMQLSLVQKLPQVMAEGQNIFESQNFGQKYSTSIKNASGLINEAFTTLGIEGAGWAGEATEKMMGAVLTEQDVLDGFAGSKVGTEEVLKGGWREILDGLVTEVSNSNEPLKETVSTLGESIPAGIHEGSTNMLGEIKEAMQEIGTEVLESGQEALDSHSPSQLVVPLGESIPGGVQEGVTNALPLIDEAMVSVGETVQASITGIQESLTASYEGMSNSVVAPMSTLKTNTESAFSAVQTAISAKMSSAQATASQKAQDIATSVTRQWNNISTSANKVFSDIQRTIQQKWQSIQTDTNAKWQSIVSSITTSWRNLNSTASTQFQSLQRMVQNAWQSIQTDTNAKWTAIERTFTSTLNNLQSATSTAMNAIKRDVENAMNAIKTSVESAAEKINKLKDSFVALKDALPGVKSGLDNVRISVQQLNTPVSTFNQTLLTTESNLGRAVTALQNAGKAVDDFKAKFNTELKFKVKIPVFALNGKFDAENGTVPTVYIARWDTYAQGGFPEDGFFFANSTELVGRFDNGKTAVANNEQIIAGIERGVENAIARKLESYLSSIERSNNAIAEKDFGVSLDGRDLVHGIEERQRRNGWRFQTT